MAEYCVDCYKKFGFFEKKVLVKNSIIHRRCVECNEKRENSLETEYAEYKKMEIEMVDDFRKLSDEEKKEKYEPTYLEALRRKEREIYGESPEEEKARIYEEKEEEYEKWSELSDNEKEEGYGEKLNKDYEKRDLEEFEAFKKLTKNKKSEFEKKKFARYTAREQMELIRREREELKELEAWEKEKRSKEKLKRLRKMKKNDEAGVNISDSSRELIPADIRDYVWSRDKGKCLSCGSNKNLHFDHIIPVSKGGATTTENLQVLCKDCNLKKSDHI